MSEVGAHRLVFVGALPRSGMSRLIDALATHPEVSVLDPGWDPSHAPDEVRRLFIPSPSRIHARKPAVPSMEHLTETSPYASPSTAEALWRSWAPHWDLSRRVLVHAWSNNLTRSRLLQSLFTSSAFVMLQRHPLVVVEGALRPAGLGRSAALRYWLRAHETMTDDLTHVDGGLVISYEDLLVEQDAVYQRLLEHIGLVPSPLAERLPMAGNDPFYETASSGFEALSSRLASRALARRISRAGYLLRPPFLVNAAAAPSEPVLTAPAPTAKPPERLAASVGADPSPGMTTTLATSPAPRHEAAVAHGMGGGVGSSPDPAPTNELRRAAKGGLAFTSGIVVNAVFQFVFVVLLAHLLDQSSVGALLEAVAIFTICSLTYGADTGLLRFVPIFRRRRPEDLGRLFAVALGPVAVISPMVSALIFIFAPQLVHLFVHKAAVGHAVTALRILACGSPAVTLTTGICAGLRGWSNRPSVLLQTVLQPVGRVLILAVFAAVGVTLTLAAVAYVVPILVAFALALALLMAKVPLRRRGRRDRSGSEATEGLAREFWRFSGPSFFGLVFQTLILQLDVLLVGAFLSARQAAAYSVASRYVIAGTFGLQAIISSVSPQLSRLMDSRDYAQAKLVYTSSTWWAIAASWPVLLVLATYAPVFQRLFGHGYTSAAVALAILATAMLVNTGTGPNGSLLYMAGHSGLSLAIWGLGLAVNVGLNIWLIPTLGLTGAALAWAATILVVGAVTSGYLWLHYGIQPLGSGYAKIAGAALGCFGVLGLLGRAVFGTSVAGFVLFALVSSALYASLVWRWRNDLNLSPFESLARDGARRVRHIARRTVRRSPALEGRAKGY